MRVKRKESGATALLPSASDTGVRLDDGSELRSDLAIVA